MRRSALRIVALFALISLNALAADLTGKWSGSFRADGADHNVPQLLILKQNGNDLTGSGGPNESEQYPIEHGRVDGNRVSFEITTGEWKFAYDLKVTDKRLAGSIDLATLNDKRTAKVSLTKTN